MTDRWQVKECPRHGIVTVNMNDHCPMCWCELGAPFEVVRSELTIARAQDPDTSKLAALRQAPRSQSQRGQILAALRDLGPMTSRQIEEATGINGAWKRVSELKQGEHICELRTEHDPQTNTDVTVYAVAGAEAEPVLVTPAEEIDPDTIEPEPTLFGSAY